MNKYITIIFLFIFFSKLFSLNAQTSEGMFTGKTETYLIELTDFFTLNSLPEKKKQNKEFLLQFTTKWNSGQVNENNKQLIATLSVQMQKKKMQPYPQFYEYLTVVGNVIDSQQSEKTIQNWHLALTDFASQRTSQAFLEFLAFSKDFFGNSLLYNSATTSWKATSKGVNFIFDKEPVISFSEPFNLICYANNDSSVIYNTTGTFYPKQNLWKGNYGKVDWQRAGFKPEALYADFSKYQLDIRKREYTVDSVQLYYPEFFGTQVLTGTLEERVLANRTGEDAIYPAFQTKGSRFRINNIFPDIDYEGGYSIKGARLVGSGDEQNDAFLFINRNGTRFIKFAAKSYIIRKDRISSDRAAITIYWEGDSIFHPNMPMKYMNQTREISAIREREGLSQAPYTNSYHKLEMNFEAMYWKMDQPVIDFRMIIGPGSEGSAYFTSQNYFSDMEFEKVRGIDDIHPLITLRNCAKQYNNRVILVSDYAAYLKKQVEGVRNQVIRLAVDGFVLYDPTSDKFLVKDKVFDFLDASSKRKDYDVIKFNSVITAQSNATLSLLNFDLKMRGISRVFLSDSQSVFIYPKNQEIIVKKNRDFSFDGVVRVGLFDFFGSNFYFDYDQFKVNMPLIDSLSFRVVSRKPDEYGNFPLVRVKSTLEDLSGDVLIDHPSNKSGLKPFHEYPIFNSKKPSFVYYDKKSVYPGKYSRDKFFYRVEPFQLDSLNDMTTDRIEFVGYLASAGIFPDIHQPVKVQEDYSLGFIYDTPKNGLEAYGGKGTFTNKVDLSNQGLRGDGTISYLTSLSQSKNYVFFPDMTIGENVEKFYVAEQKTKTEYPLVNAVNVSQEWKPYEDILTSTSKASPFEIYAEKTLLSGKLDLTPKALTGKGLMEFYNAEIASQKFVYNNRIFNSDTCDFRLKTYDLKEMAFVTENYNGNIDMDKKLGKFKSNGGTSMVKFPANQYICFMDQFDWHMEKDEIDLRTDQEVADYSKVDIRSITDLDLSGSEFISVHPKQDSLSFKSPRAKYNLKEQIIYAFNVELIRVADAAIIPSDGKVTVLKQAEMLPLENSKILANTTTKYHIISEAETKIFGKKSYTSSGKYTYVDELEQPQIIYLNSVKVDSTLQTIAQGNITEKEGFTLSPFFDFYGDVNLQANNKYLLFDGGTRVKNDCDTVTKNWFRFKTEINPKEIFIPVDTVLKDMNNVKLFAGIYFSRDSLGVYTAFLAPKYSGGDIEVATAKGWLMYDKITNQYRISSMAKLLQPTLPGNYLSFDRMQCTTYSEGKLSLGANLGRVSMNLFGKVNQVDNPSSTQINSVITLDFMFNDDAMKLVHESIATANGLEGVSLNSELFSKYLGEVLGLELADKAMSEIALYGQMKKYPKELEHTLTLTDVKFVYNPASKSYVSEGKIGIHSVGKTQINRLVDGKIELQLRRGGDKLTFYIEVTSTQWFYFSYSNGLMQAISSSKEFNDYIINTKPEARQVGAKDGQKAYSYYISTPRRKEAFLKKIEIDEDEEKPQDENSIQQPPVDEKPKETEQEKPKEEKPENEDKDK